ncbi:MAG: hypothetical protein IK150_08950 [Lachnospiraceae bacterium]|nr:hypothetical protein [Lachnospiraceae bacterium]
MINKRRLACFSLALLLILGLLCGCVRKDETEKLNTFGGTKDSFYLFTDLAVQDVTIENFETKKYDVKEYQGFLEEEIAEYNRTHAYTPKSADGASHSPDEPHYSESVTLVRCEVLNEKLFQSLLYATAADYNSFPDNQIVLSRKNGSGLVTGTLADAPDVLRKTSFVTPNGTSVDLESIITSQKAAEYRFMLADFSCVMYGDGEIIAYANGMEYSKENNCAGIGKAKYAIMIFH